MPISKPLTFICQKLVLQYLDLDLRLELYQKCFRIRAAHRAAPLELEHFDPKNFEVCLNSTCYKLGVIRHYPGVTPPKWVRDENEAGGARFNVGRFADLKNYRTELRAQKDHVPTDEETAKNFKAQEKLAQLLPHLKYLKESGAKAERLEVKVKELQWEIQNYNEQLAVSKLKFVEFIQLTIVTKNQKTIERVCYGIPLQNALDYLLDTVLCIENKVQVNRKMKLEGLISRSFTVKLGKFKIELEIEQRKIQSIVFPHKNNTRLKGIFPAFGSIKISELEIVFEVVRGGEEEKEALNAMKALAETEEIREKIERKIFPCTIHFYHNNMPIFIRITTRSIGDILGYLTFTLYDK